MFQSSAVTLVSSDWQNKIPKDIYACSQRKEDKYYVALRLNTVSDEVISAEFFKQAGYDMKKYEDHERYQTEIVTTIKQEIANEFNAKIVSGLITRKEIERKQQEAISADAFLRASAYIEG